MISINKISLKIKTSFSAIRASFVKLWKDDGTSAIANPWNDANTWSDS